MDILCIVCNAPLTGGLDTFGELKMEMCWSCWSSLGDEPDGVDSWYGLAPHHHAYDDQGNIIIGGTVFDPLPEPNENGDYVLGNLIFTPDLDSPGCGIWSRR